MLHRGVKNEAIADCISRTKKEFKLKNLVCYNNGIYEGKKLKTKESTVRIAGEGHVTKVTLLMAQQ